jgi:predicted DCC family thiol-disulfide oxidoreductase YuxK
MRRLTVIYDAGCGFCVRCRDWLEKQPAFLELECIWSRSHEAATRFPGLVGPGTAELVVIDDEGGVYRGARAWIMCLYALRDYREWSLSLASPALFPFARRAFELVSASRGFLSRLLGLSPEREFARAVDASRSASVAVVPASGRVRCGYCHADADGTAETCPRCRSILHSDCRDELGRCPTIGCGGGA